MSSKFPKLEDDFDAPILRRIWIWVSRVPVSIAGDFEASPDGKPLRVRFKSGSVAL